MPTPQPLSSMDPKTGKIAGSFRHFIWHLRDRQRTLLCAPLGLAAGCIGWWLLGWNWEVATLFGWILAVGGYLALLGFVIFVADGPMTQHRVSKDDPSPLLLLIVLTLVALLGNATVGIILTSVGHRSAEHARILLSLGVVSVLLSWFLLHTAFGQQFARLYYDEFDEAGNPFAGGRRGGFQIPGADLPSYSDFLYIAFTVGLTYAMSDVTVTSDKIRRMVLIHSVISFFFYSTVLGVVLNAIVTS